ncbi:MAG: lysozyme inhibitor LprI family protein [Pseudomonadota bacterium]
MALVIAAPAAASDIGLIDACVGPVGDPDDHAEWCKGVVAEPCIARNEQPDTNHLVQCINREVYAWDDIMKREFDGLIGALDEEQRVAMRFSQRHWIEYRDAECVFPHIFLRQDASRPWAADCMLHHTADRALELRGYRDYLTTE